MSNRIFTGAKSDLLPEIEKFRELQAFCSHDLRSQVGAVAGLLQLLEDQLSSLDDKTKSSYAAALTSAQDALENLDSTISTTKPYFEVVWLVGFTDDDVIAIGLEAALQAQNIKRAKPVLFVTFAAAEEWQPRVKKYRPLAVVLKNTHALGADASMWVSRLGPQLTKILLLEGSGLEGVRPEAVTALNATLTNEAGRKICDAIDALPQGRS